MGSPSVGSPLPGSKKGWVARNWKWLLPAACLALIVLSAAFVGGVFLLVESSFRNSDVCTQALTQVRANPEVIEGIGQHLKAEWLVSGNIQVTGSSGYAELSIPISGPNGKGTIYATARKSAGIWQFEALQVEIKGRAERIDLLQNGHEVPAARRDST
jgi:Cytochrome oxidase complex assembly protein 1